MFDRGGKTGHPAGMKTKPLPLKSITEALAGLPEWTFAKNALVKTYEFETFRDAMAFMMRAAFEAEALNHHPEWTNVYNRVTVRLNTHDAGGKVTAKDFELARRLEHLPR